MATEHKHSTKHKQQQQEQQQRKKQTFKTNHQGQEKQRPEGKSIITANINRNQTPPKGGDGHVTNSRSKLLKKQTPVVVSSEGEDAVGQTQQDKRGKEHFLRKQSKAAVEIDEQDEEEELFYDDIYDGRPPDYRIYQEGQVNEFFDATITNGTASKDNEPKTVSEICLVNDHYILVKMPLQPGISDSAAEGAPESPKSPMADQSNMGKLCHYLRKKPKRIQKIAPINSLAEGADHLDVIEEEKEADLNSSKSLHCLNVNSCWSSKSDDVEIYESKTTIRRTPSKMKSQGIIMVKSEEEEVEKTCQDKSSQTPPCKVRNNNNNYNKKATDNREPKDLQTISGSMPMSSSLQKHILIHNVGSLIADGDDDPNRWNINNSRKNAPTYRRKRFLWFLLPFRSKYRRAQKAKPKIQAVVYKSYFVKWTKPPESLNHGFGGVKSSKLGDLGASVLRRCRSAIF
ncbi:uncharacterized protein [Musca autumnalis]|uniref:uncharacterized protein n=1 Tax=Musca autumnalis TaxID=221902 RepID=UPI003CEDEE9F